MIDIEKVRTIISNILQEQQLTISVERHNDLVDVLFAFDELKRLQEFKTTFDNYELSQKQGFIAYENWQECEKQIKELQKKVVYQEQYKNSKYVVIQDSVAKGFEFDNIKEAVDKLYSLKGNHEYDMGILACVGGDKAFMIAERKLDWSSNATTRED